MTDMNYRIEKTQNQRWGIYQGERLLATVGSYEACESIWKYLQKELSYTENIKSRISYRSSINKHLLIQSSSNVG